MLGDIEADDAALDMLHLCNELEAYADEATKGDSLRRWQGDYLEYLRGEDPGTVRPVG